MRMKVDIKDQMSRPDFWLDRFFPFVVGVIAFATIVYLAKTAPKDPKVLAALQESGGGSDANLLGESIGPKFYSTDEIAGLEGKYLCGNGVSPIEVFWEAGLFPGAYAVVDQGGSVAVHTIWSILEPVEADQSVCIVNK